MNQVLKTTLLSIILLFVGSTISAEKVSSEERKLYKKAKKALVKEDYTEAKISYESLVKIAPNNDLYQFEAGLSYYFSNLQRAKSVKFFEDALKNSGEDTIPELKYYLGRAYHLNGDFEKSKSTLSEFIPEIQSHKAGQKLLKETNYRIALNDNGIKYATETNENIKIENQGADINTPDREYAPVYRKDDNIILFTSRRKQNKGKTAVDLLPYEDIYAAKKSGETSWTLISDNKELSKYLPDNFNSKKHDAGVIYSIDGNTLYTYKKDRLWKSERKDGKWSNLEPLDDNINESQLNVPSISVSQDGKVMFFVATKKEGFGGSDIYKSTKNENGEWSDPEILGAEINTEFDEDGPFLSKDGKTFYFSSKGHNGIGGYDIFKSDLIDGKPSTPINLGIPLNSPADDIYIVMEDDKIGFFSSNREGSLGSMDIFSVCMNCPTTVTNIIKGLIVDNNDSPVNNGTVTIKNINSDETLGNYPTTAGVFDVTTESIGKHELIIEADNYEKQLTYIELPSTSSTSDIKVQLNQFEKDSDRFQVISITSPNSKLNRSDTIKLEPLVAVVDSNDNGPSTPSEPNAISYQENFGYNINEINAVSPDYVAVVNKAVKLIGSNGKVSIDIESSASRVPTKTYKTNIKLASLRGDQARDLIIKSLLDKGVSKDNIVVTKINSIVSGPKYLGDFKNTEKYHKYQYVKITIK